MTDIIKAKDGDFFISDWLRNRNTLEYLGAWESMFNPDFNYGEFAIIKSKAGLNNFKISIKEWHEKTNAIGIVARAGRYGGTYAHKDIAFEFCSAISPMFKLYVIKEYQRLVELKRSELALSWNVKRLLSKANYHIHTDAIKNVILPKLNISQIKQGLVYASEADLLNMVLFDCTAKQWQEANPELAKTMNIRDTATINQLIVLFIIHTQETISRGNSITELPLFHYPCPVMADLIGHLFVILRHTRCPAVLTENFFMDCYQSDRDYLQINSGRQAIILKPCLTKIHSSGTHVARYA